MNIKTNSKYVKKNDIFVCIHDELEDRHKYIKDIKVASAIIIDKEVKNQRNIPLIKVKDTNDTLFNIYNNYYNEPLKNLNIIAVTGTDGKTTTAIIIKQLLDNFIDTGYIGTNGFIYKDNHIKTKNTTPSIDIILKYASILKNENINTLIMEASSEGLLHKRCDNLKIKRAIITNVTGDHLNIHKTFDNYLNSKLKLFKLLTKDGIAIINKEDISYDYIKKMKIKKISYGKKDANYQINNIKEFSNKTTFTLIHNKKSYKVESPLLGKFNAYNLMSAIICLNTLGYDMEKILDKVKYLKPISGRMNIFYTKNNAQIILDYAHTLKATTEILKFANNLNKKNIITILGSAGGREKKKRKYIGKIASDLSNKVIFTMDDPRNEKVENIVKDLTKDITKKNYIYIKNRKKAIKYAIKNAKENDLILILGKGTDDYMAVRDKYKKYNDLKVIKKYI